MKDKYEDDEKIDVTKSVFQSAKEMQEQRQAELEQQQLEMQHKAEEREKKKREEYEKKIREERIELMRLKQGIIEESETIHEEHEEEVQLTFGQKISNFFYHNKWWLGVGVMMVFIAVFLIYNLVTRPKPDMAVLVLCDNEEFGYSEGLEKYLESFAEDFNGNGEILVSVYYIPYSSDAYVNYQRGVDNKLTAELQSADSIIAVGGDNIKELFDGEEVFTDLSEIFPDNEHIDGYKFYVKDTPIAERIGASPDIITDDMYFAVRKPQKLMYSDEEEMQETYDRDFPIFEKIIEDLSK